MTTESTDTEEAASSSAADAGAAPADGEDVDWKAEAEKWQKMSRKTEAQAKANAEKAKAYDAAQKAGQSAEERAAAAEERAVKALRRAAAAKVEALAATRFQDPTDAVDGLPVEDFVSDDGVIDEDAIRAALDGLLERKPHWAKNDAPAGPRRPRPDPGQGPRADQAPSIDAQIKAANDAGNVGEAIRLKNIKQRQQAAAK